MSKLFAAVMLIGAVLCAGSAQAQAQDSELGLGAMLGEPTGVNGKYWLSGSNAVDMGASWSLRDNESLHLHADYLWHDFSVFDAEDGRMPIHYGVGGRLLFQDDDRAGVRGVVGLSYLFDRHPMDIFFEVAPILDVIPDTEMNFNGAFGSRYYF